MKIFFPLCSSFFCFEKAIVFLVIQVICIFSNIFRNLTTCILKLKTVTYFVFLEILFFIHCSGHKVIASFQIIFFSSGKVCYIITLIISSPCFSWFSLSKILYLATEPPAIIHHLKNLFFLCFSNFSFCSTFCKIFPPTLPSVLLLNFF